MPAYVIYKILFPNYKVYIGLSSSFRRRKSAHLDHARSGGGFAVHSAIRKYGEDSISWHILEEGLSHKEACERERYYIHKFSSYGEKGYNATLGGEGTEQWTIDLVKKVIQELEITTISEWERLSNRSYDWACRTNLARKIAIECGVEYSITYWDKQKVFDLLKEKGVTRRAQWFRISQHSYSWAAKHKLLDYFASFLSWDERNSWSKDLVIEDIIDSGFTSMQDWREGSPLSYAYASKHKFTREVESLMRWKPFRKEDGYTDEELFALTSKFSSIADWRASDSRSYGYAKK